MTDTTVPQDEPRRTAAQINNGAVRLFKNKEYDRSVATFKDAISKDPTLALVYLNLAKLLVFLDRND